MRTCNRNQRCILQQRDNLRSPVDERLVRSGKPLTPNIHSSSSPLLRYPTKGYSRYAFGREETAGRYHRRLFSEDPLNRQSVRRVKLPSRLVGQRLCALEPAFELSSRSGKPAADAWCSRSQSRRGASLARDQPCSIISCCRVVSAPSTFRAELRLFRGGAIPPSVVGAGESPRSSVVRSVWGRGLRLGEQRDLVGSWERRRSCSRRWSLRSESA